MQTLDSMEGVLVQEPYTRAGSTEVGDGIVLPQRATPVLRQLPADEPSSSPLSVAPTLPCSPVSIKTESDENEMEAGRTEATSVASTVRPKIRRRRPDPCADAGFVVALQVPDTDPSMPMITNSRRISQRIRDSTASKSSHTGAPSTISPPATRRKSKNTMKHPANIKQEEMRHKLGSPKIFGDAEPFPLSAGNRVQQAPLASNKDVMALSGLALKRKHEEEGQNLEGSVIPGLASTAAAIGTEHACIRAKSLPFGDIDKSGASSAGLGKARRYSIDKDPGGLEPLTERRGMIIKDTMYTNDQLDTRLRPRKPTAKSEGALNLSGDPESTQSTDNEDEDSESYVEDGGPSSNADSILPDEALSSKKQKLNNGQALALPVTKSSGEFKEPDVRDPRVNEHAFRFIEGVLCIPHGCDSCRDKNAFCDRAQPCDRCQRVGRGCSTKPGWEKARPKQKRTRQGDVGTRTPALARLTGAISPSPSEATSSRKLETSPLQNTPVGKRGRPRKPDIKNEIKSETKESKKVKPLLWSLIDFQKGKPPGIRQPEVWCETRQELCESLPYYRSYQAGCYGHDGLVHGYLLDGFASPRDYISSKVVISHSGGKSGTDDSGQRRLLADQTIDDNTIKYLIKNMNQKWPLVMIMGNQCTNSPSRVPHRYCVMDWFKVTVAWAEKDSLSQCTRWKFRFEKLNTNADGWWAAAPSEEPNPPQEIVKASCLGCRKESPHIYEQGWACLSPNCKSFWMLNGVDMPAELSYTENFLSCRTLWPEDFLQPPNSLAPPLDTEVTAHVESGGVSRPFWKGMCCPKCGRLSCRELWAGWLCPTCGFSYNPPRVVFDAARLADPHRPVYTGPAIPSNLHNEEITSKRFVRDGMTVVQYQLGDCGTVTHILANRVSNSRPEDANWLLENYQNLDMPFRRFPMKCHHSQGRLLTQQFMYNCGAPYKFIVDVNSLPFSDSPPVVLKALDLIHKRVKLIYPEAEFNEVLNVGYFEKQKMDYHDDGEEGLGETVASISLGGSARMKFRVKSKYKDERHCWTTEPEKDCQDAGSGDVICNDENIEDEDEENSGEIAAGLQTDAPSMRAKGRSNKAMLDLCLNHGDVMVMKGAGIQTHWEHTVVPIGLFRIAATARYIAQNAPGNVPKQQTTKETQTDGNDATLPLTDTMSIKAGDSAMDVDNIQTTSTSGLSEPDQPSVIGEKPNFSQSAVDLHEPGFTTSPSATVPGWIQAGCLA